MAVDGEELPVEQAAALGGLCWQMKEIDAGSHGYGSRRSRGESEAGERGPGGFHDLVFKILSLCLTGLLSGIRQSTTS